VRKLPKRSLAVAGNCCAGKTTLLNVLFGLKLEEAPWRNTSGFENVLSTDALDGYDVFGTNNEETYIEMKNLVKMKAVHIIACMYTDCVENVLDLAKLMQALRSNSREPFTLVFVRNKMDTVDAKYHDELHTRDLTKLRTICPDCELALISCVSGIGLEEIKAQLSRGASPA
jgi:GTP-binding protein EngB required for normal cell division